MPKMDLLRSSGRNKGRSINVPSSFTEAITAFLSQPRPLQAITSYLASSSQTLLLALPRAIDHGRAVGVCPLGVRTVMDSPRGFSLLPPEGERVGRLRQEVAQMV